MEFLFELFFEFIVEGAIEAASEKRVPIPFRILAAVFVVVVFGGVVFLMIFAGILCLRSEDNLKAIAILMFLVAGVFAFGLLWRAVRHYKNRTSGEGHR